MKSTDGMVIYSPLEERINVLSHAFGLALSVVALIFLVIKASLYGTAWHIVSAAIYGASMIVLYSASTFYHKAQRPVIRKRLRIFDHASIYVLIAGTYTPFTLVTLHGTTGWIIFGLSWGMALTGIILKIFFTGRYNLLSTLMYVFMGWLIVFVISPLMDRLAADGLRWLFAGGAAYTLGAVIYSIKKIKLNHAIFHLFVLLGSFCHFMAVYFYVLPPAA